MIIRFATKTNSSGLQYQLKVDTATKEFQYGSHLFVSADVHQLTKKEFACEGCPNAAACNKETCETEAKEETK